MSAAPIANGLRSHTTRGALLETFDGDEEFVGELVAAFLIRSPELVEEIRSALELGDTAAASRSGHALKGMIGYFDEREAEAAVRSIEEITPADLGLAPVFLLAMERRLDELTRYLVEEFAR